MNTENIVSDLVFKQLLLDADNTMCFDCAQPNPQWASVNNGIFICMNCAALHRSMGVQTSFVRSLSMDTWTNDQLKLMALGGNKKMRAYFHNYDLNDESISQRYTTNASEYYRLQLRQQSEGIVFGEKTPSYEHGREQVPVEEQRSAEEIMLNNPPFQGGMDNDGDNAYTLYPDVSKLKSSASTYLSWASEKAKENVYYASDVAKQKGQEYGVADKVTGAKSYMASSAAQLGVTEKVSGAKDYVVSSAQQMGVTEKVSGAKDYVVSSASTLGDKVKTSAVENAAALQQSAQEGTLTKKAQENAQYGASYLYGWGSQIYSSASTYMAGQQQADAQAIAQEDKNEGQIIDSTVNLDGDAGKSEALDQMDSATAQKQPTGNVE